MTADRWREYGWQGSAVMRLDDRHPVTRLVAKPAAGALASALIPMLRVTYPTCHWTFTRAATLADASDGDVEWVPPRDHTEPTDQGCPCVPGECTGDCGDPWEYGVVWRCARCDAWTDVRLTDGPTPLCEPCLEEYKRGGRPITAAEIVVRLGWDPYGDRRVRAPATANTATRGEEDG